MLKLMATFITLFGITIAFAGNQCGNIFEIPWYAKSSFETKEHELINAEYSAKIDLRFYLISQNVFPTNLSSNRFLVRFSNGEQAVFKPELILFHSYGEVGAYNLSKYLGVNLVPPTVIRGISNLKGSIQTYIPPSPDVYFTFKRNYSKLSAKTKSEIELFAYLIGHRPIDQNNLIFDEIGNPAMVDNGDFIEISLIGTVGFNYSIKKFSESFINKIKGLNFENLKLILPSHFSDKDFEVILSRRDQILEAAKRGTLI